MPSPYPCLPKNRNAAAMCSFIHLRFSCISVNMGMPRSFRVPLRSPRAVAWNCSSSVAVVIFVSFSGSTTMDRSACWFVVTVTVEVNMFVVVVVVVFPAQYLKPSMDGVTNSLNPTQQPTFIFSSTALSRPHRGTWDYVYGVCYRCMSLHG